jgi:hypothetical protein
LHGHLLPQGEKEDAQPLEAGTVTKRWAAHILSENQKTMLFLAILSAPENAPGQKRGGRRRARVRRSMISVSNTKSLISFDQAKSDPVQVVDFARFGKIKLSH